MKFAGELILSPSGSRVAHMQPGFFCAFFSGEIKKSFKKSEKKYAFFAKCA